MSPDDTADVDPVLHQRAGAIAGRLGLTGQSRTWLESLASNGASPPQLPGDTEARGLLEQLGVAGEDRTETLAARPLPDRDPDLWWLLERAYGGIVGDMGRRLEGGWSGWLRALPPGTGPVGSYLYVWLYLALLPYTRRYHTDHGVPEDVTDATTG
jgi:hypothetical protein